VLVSLYSFIGAAIAKILSSFVGLIYLLLVLYRTNQNLNFISRHLFIWSSLVLFLGYAISFFSLFIYLPAILFLIILLTQLTQVFNNDERTMIKSIFIKNAKEEI
jgi:Na+-driven multidrug efflux pump